MHIPIQPNSQVPLHVQIASWIRKAMSRNEWETGESLPPVRDWSRELRVSPRFIEQAYTDLESEGSVLHDRVTGEYRITGEHRVDASDKEIPRPPSQE